MKLVPIILLATTLTTSTMVAAGTIAGTIAALTGALANNHDECSRIHPRVLNAIDTFLESSTYGPRSSMLHGLERIGPVLAQIGGPALIRAVVRDIESTAEWWP